MTTKLPVNIEWLVNSHNEALLRKAFNSHESMFQYVLLLSPISKFRGIQL